MILAEIVLEAGYPPEAFSMLNAWGRDTEMMVLDPRIAMISFTGSAAVGWMLKSKAGQKKVTLELGGNAGVIVHSDADLADAASQAAAGGFANAGQNCISVQRLLIQRDVFEEFTDRFVDEVKALKVGDPRDPDVDIGPMISERDAERAEAWVQRGAAGGRSGTLWRRTRGHNVPADGDDGDGAGNAGQLRGSFRAGGHA